MQITIVVRDTPRPGGSKIAGFNRKTGKGFVRPASEKTATWRNSVRAAAFEQYKGKPLKGALQVSFQFFFNRPKSHYGSGKNADKLKLNAPEYHSKKPDLTKLIRSTEDALTNICWVDDSQICIGDHHGKFYANEKHPEGCAIWILPLDDLG